MTEYSLKLMKFEKVAWKIDGTMVGRPFQDDVATVCANNSVFSGTTNLGKTNKPAIGKKNIKF